MTIVAKIIHCQVDQEPKTFHRSDLDDKTISFAVNLSFECASDGQGDVTADETEARKLTLDFLEKARSAEFALYSKGVNGEDTFELNLLPEVPELVREAPAADAVDLHDWLDREKTAAKLERFWAPLDVSSESEPERTVDVNAAGAAARLRAVQAWDAPVGHRFGLTAIVRIPKSLFGTDGGIVVYEDLVVVPYFGGADPKPEPIEAKPEDESENEKPEPHSPIQFDYDAYGDGDKLTCRTGPIPGNTEAKSCDAFDKALTPDGYVIVNPDADQVRRVSRWFEERAASLMVPNTALGPRDADKCELHEIESMFGLVRDPDQPENEPKTKWYWDGAVWYLVSRLISALDPFVIGILKPGAEESEGEVLAPLVSLILKRMEDASAYPALDQANVQPDKVVKAIRKAFADNSPLRRRKDDQAEETDQLVNNARIGFALKHIYAIAAPRLIGDSPEPIVDDNDLVSELLFWFIGRAGAALKEAPYENPSPGRHLDETHLVEFAKKLDKITEQDCATYSGAPADTLSARVTRAAVALEQRLMDEAGAEKAILSVLETVETPIQNDSAPYTWVGERLSALVGAAYAAAEASGNAAVAAAASAAVEAALIEYRALLDGPFNGAEAVRRAAGACLAKAALTDAGKGEAVFPASAVIDAIETIQKVEQDGNELSIGYFELRFFPTQDKQISALHTVEHGLASVDLDWLQTQDLLKTRLRKIYDATVVEPFKALLNPPRFIPDSFPQPLPIQIGANIDGSKIDAFARDFNGFGLAIRRMDAKDSKWAHAHLADFWWTKGKSATPTPEVEGALSTMLPAVSDGRGPMFIEYEGFPFADPPAEERRPDKGEAPADAREAFYTPQPHEPHGGNPFSATPRLAYGRKFETFSFVTSNAGAMPLALQESAPWTPKPDVPKPEGDAVIDETSYRRRTAIAEMSLGDEKKASLGQSIPGVQPLAEDYPRAAIISQDGVDGVCDLLKDRDGIGAIVTPDDDGDPPAFAWTIDDMRWEGDPGALVLQLYDKAAQPGDKPAFAHELDVSAKPERLDFSLRTAPQGSAAKYLLELAVDGHAKPFNVDSALGPYCWLRIRLQPKSGKAAALSFAELEQGASGASGGPLVLLAPYKPAPGKPTVWRNGLTYEAALPVSTPRVSYLDFERWFANADNRVAGDENLHKALLLAYCMRHLDVDLAKLIDRLPDPAVEAIRLEFVTTDELSAAVPVSKAKTMSLTKAFKDFLATVSDSDAWLPKDLIVSVKDFLTRLDRTFRFAINLVSADVTDLVAPSELGDDVTCNAAPGCVTRLSMSALVSKAHFSGKGDHPSVFDDRLLQYALRDVDGGRVAFPSAAVRVEVMYDGLEESKFSRAQAVDLAATMISAKPAQRARSYQLMTAGVAPETELKRWRVLGEIDITTQRWRPTGRPIYSWIQPETFAVNRASARLEAALPIAFKEIDGDQAADENRQLDRFEREAFFDRQNFDARTVTQRLSPLGGTTSLETHQWDAPSATYFRHRFTLRSRYAGALTQNREIAAWPEPPNSDPTVPNGWTQRVAMLADVTRVPATRPQLRALIPLTTAPGGNGERPAPPAVAILQEPPFARGGLADRVASELKTGFGYGFKPTNDQEEKEEVSRVTILDSRKEVGPTPYLTYEALSEASAQAMTLVSEGPLGLTFDAVNAAAPAFPNTMISLRPTALRDDVDPRLEDLFLGVAMRRYIDPAWAVKGTTDAGASKLPSFDADRTLWIDVTIALEAKASMCFGEKALKILTFERPGNQIVAKASILAIDGVGEPDDDPVQIASVDSARVGQVSILHHPIAPGRYSTSILAQPVNVAVDEGLSGAPLVLASFEWSDHDAKEEKASANLWFEEALKPIASETVASAATILKWTRTGRDFDFVHAVATNGDDDWAEAVEAVSDLDATLDGDPAAISIRRAGTAAPMWICSSTFKSRFPLHVHRHVGLITTSYLTELGRPVEVFCRSAASGNRKPALFALGESVPPPEKAVRIVEFETPAAILCDSGIAAPERFKSAYFDLVSIGFDYPGAIKLFLRFVGQPGSLKKLKGLELTFWPASRTEKAKDYETWKISLELKDLFPVGLYVTLRPGKAAQFDLLQSDGLRKPPVTVTTPGKPYQVEAAKIDKPGFWLSVRATSSGGQEFWTDVSALHSKETQDRTPFNFDWLFSQAFSGEAAQSVTAVELNGMVEAQARIVAVSPPIAIKPG